MARVDALSEDARHVLGVLAVIGRRADHRLVAALCDLDDAALLGALRDAVAQQVLITESDDLTYRFRHALVHEAVYDDLLPGERVQLHARLAGVLTEHPEWFEGGDAGLASELACHWYAAYDLRRALPAALEAAHAAERMYAYPESLAHVERALAIWPQVADAEELTGMRHVDVLRHAAMQADFEGSGDRALDFIRAAAAEVDAEADPITAGLIHEKWARYLWVLNASWETILQHCDEAVRLVPASPTSVARARVVATLGQQLMLAGRNAEAIKRCREAIAIAVEVGERVVEGHARNTLGSALAAIGENDAGLAQLHLAREIAEDVGSWGDVARAAINEGGALQVLGRHAEALALSVRGVEIARTHGLDRSCGAFLRLNAAESLWALGRWDEVEEQLREVDGFALVGIDAWRTAEQSGTLLAARATSPRPNTALTRCARSSDRIATTRLHMAIALLEVRIAAGRGDLAAGRRYRERRAGPR